MPYTRPSLDRYARNRLSANHRGVLSENFPLHLVNGFTIMPTAGLLNLMKVPFPTPGVITNVCIYISTAGATLTSGQNFGILYSAAGVKLGATATMHTAWTGTGIITMPLTSAYTAAAADYYVGIYYNGTTAPTLARAAVTGAVNGGTSAPNLLWCTADSGLTTTIPDPIGAQTSLSNSWWAALS